MPNHLLAYEKLKGAEPRRAFEGYRNPLFLFARQPETDAPDKNAPGTLVVRPGRLHTVEAFAAARIIYFEPGLHDYAQFNPADRSGRAGPAIYRSTGDVRRA